MRYLSMCEGMQHPLEFIPLESRKQSFVIFLALSLILFAVFRLLDAPFLSYPYALGSREFIRSAPNIGIDSHSVMFIPLEEASRNHQRRFL